MGQAAPGGPRDTVVGIDLGTTHTALAWAVGETGAQPRALAIPQWVAGRRRSALPLLPSALYAPLPGELPEVAERARDWVIGEYARIRTQETAGRSITSAKSWLCHAGVERLGAILPWGVDDGREVQKLSPVDASCRILRHVRAAFEEQHPGLALDELGVVLTVPASFDPTARKLTVLAAERAGLRVRLLEEPQAAFYDYLGQHARELEQLVSRRGALQVLVCDLGGGTMDLSLIEVERAASGLAFRRSAVGRHLLLGGDNMDLAIARLIEKQLVEDPLDPERFGQLLLASRVAKETLLGAHAPEAFPVRLLGSGAQLLGRVLSADVQRAAVQSLVLDGFFPLTQASDLPDARRSALTTFGLPYERDPAVTRHIAQFLARHTAGKVPGALLLNGGVTESPLISQRLLDCLRGWGPSEVTLLSATDPQLAVCRGAVRYALSLRGLGPRIEGGAAQGYYVAVDGGEGGPRQALCVVPRGAKEGERHVVGSRRFELTLGRPARFELYASDTALHTPGTQVELDRDFQALPPVTTELRLGDEERQARALVQLEGELSAVGTLELGCTVLSDERDEPTAFPLGRAAPRLSLAFELEVRAELPASAGSAAASGRARSAPLDAAKLLAAEAALQRVFGKGRSDVGPREVKDLLRTLERSLGPRKAWDLELSRRLGDVLLAGSQARLRSEDHERMFWMLAGQCLRPGFGHARDAERMARLWPTFDVGLRYREADRSWQQYWIAWRRMAGGLDAAMQTAVRDLLDTVLAPPELKRRKPKSFRPAALDELLSLASHLERVDAERRAELGRWILERTWTERDPRLWTYLGRVGARVPSYASAHYALKALIVERWVEQLLRERWSEVSTAASSAVSLSRVTGDRVRDLSAKVRAEVVEALRRAGAPDEHRRAVLELVPITVAEREEQLGDDLPLGLRLID